MKELLKTLRLAFYVCALPLVATAAASAHQWLMVQEQDQKPTESIVETSVELAQEIAPARNHVVKIGEDGSVRGRLWAMDAKSEFTSGMEGFEVYFVKGDSKTNAVTDADGQFSINGLEPGVYSFIAINPAGIAAFGVKVVDKDTEGVSAELKIETAVISSDVEIVRNLFSTAKYEKSANNIVASETPKVSGANRVYLEDGKLVGRVVSFYQNANLENTKVILMQNEEKVAEVTTGIDGKYEFQDLKPGVYDLIATGPLGMAAIRFAAVEKEISTSTIAQDGMITAMPVQEVALAQDTTILQDERVGGTDFGYSEVVFEDPVGFTGMNVGQGVPRNGPGLGGIRRGGAGLFGLFGLLGLIGSGGGKAEVMSPKK
jgi:hypothetical protein